MNTKEKMVGSCREYVIIGGANLLNCYIFLMEESYV